MLRRWTLVGGLMVVVGVVGCATEDVDLGGDPSNLGGNAGAAGAGSGGAAGAAGGSGGVAGAAGQGAAAGAGGATADACTVDADCRLYSDCCNCMGLGTDELTPPGCPLQCIQDACSAQGTPDVRCEAGSCVPYNACAAVLCATGTTCVGGECIPDQAECVDADGCQLYSDCCVCGAQSPGGEAPAGACPAATCFVDQCSVQGVTQVGCGNGQCYAENPCALIDCQPGYTCERGQCVAVQAECGASTGCEIFEDCCNCLAQPAGAGTPSTACPGVQCFASVCAVQGVTGATCSGGQCQAVVGP